MDLGIDGRVAVVTAASRGLGRGAAMALAAEGARVVVCGRRPDVLEETERDLVAASPHGADGVAAVVADATAPDTPERLLHVAGERWGRVEIVVANNGGPPAGGALGHDDDAYRAAFEANALASIRLVRAAVDQMEGWGRICLITSVTVRQPKPELALSNTARAGLWAWAKGAAPQLFEQGITINLACPGTHLTDRIRELGITGVPLGDPDDFGRAVAFLCSQPAGFISGIALGVDGASVSGLL